MENMCYYFVYNKCKYSDKCTSRHRFDRKSPCFYRRKLNDFNFIDDVSLAKLIRLSEFKYSIKFCANQLKCSGDKCNCLHACKYHLTGKICNKTNETCDYGHSIFPKENYHNYNILFDKNLIGFCEIDLRSYIHDAYHCFKIKSKNSFTLNYKTDCNTTDTTNNTLNKTKIDSNICCSCKSDNIFKVLDICKCKYCFICYFKLKYDHSNLNLNCLVHK